MSWRIPSAGAPASGARGDSVVKLDHIDQVRRIKNLNQVTLMGRLTRDPEVRTSQSGVMVARYTLAVDRRSKDGGTDFISCVTFGKSAEFADKYLRKGIKIAISGRIQTGSYTDKDGRKVYTTDVVVNDHEFAESKNAQQGSSTTSSAQQADPDGFMVIPDGVDDIGLPFN